ncbi:MAG TPA: hypothetical protein VHM23_06465 [Actinomycetota bacterium]|jgi:hypothetical protein|nr:hypothetical protein [Actinomycetota bacterium]
MANDMPRERSGDDDARVDPDGAGPRLYSQRVPEPKATKVREVDERGEFWMR